MSKKYFHAVMLDETGCEFGVDLRAVDHEAARDQLRENYPESRVDQLEDLEQIRAREAETYARAWNIEGDYDYDYNYEDDL